MKGLLELERARREALEAARVAAQEEETAEQLARERVVAERIRPLVIAALVEEAGVEEGEFELVTVSAPADGSWWGQVGQDRQKDVPTRVASCLQLPEHNAIRVTWDVALADDGALSVRRPYRFYEVDGYDRHGPYPQARTLAEALVLAADLWRREALNQRRDVAWRAEQEEREAAQRAREVEEREALVAAVQKDGVAMALLKLFVAVQGERAGYVEMIEGMEILMDRMDERAIRRADEAARELEQARVRERELEERAWAAEDEARRR